MFVDQAKRLKERLIRSGFYDLAIAYQSEHINYWNRRVPNGTHGGVRERGANHPLLLDHLTRFPTTTSLPSSVWKEHVDRVMNSSPNSAVTPVS